MYECCLIGSDLLAYLLGTHTWSGLVRDILGLEEHDALVEDTGSFQRARILCISQGFAGAMARHTG